MLEVSLPHTVLPLCCFVSNKWFPPHHHPWTSWLCSPQTVAASEWESSRANHFLCLSHTFPRMSWLLCTAYQTLTSCTEKPRHLMKGTEDTRNGWLLRIPIQSCDSFAFRGFFLSQAHPLPMSGPDSCANAHWRHGHVACKLDPLQVLGYPGSKSIHCYGAHALLVIRRQQTVVE
jgi:hypothetical protein